MGCLWSRPCDSQTHHPDLSHNHLAGRQSSPACAVQISQIGSHRVGFRSRITKFLGHSSRKHPSNRSLQDRVSSEGSVALESLQQPSSIDNSPLLILFKSFIAEVDTFVHQTQPDNEDQRKQACHHIYGQVIGFLLDGSRIPQECTRTR